MKKKSAQKVDPAQDNKVKKNKFGTSIGRYFLPIVTVLVVIAVSVIAITIRNRTSTRPETAEVQPTPTTLPPNIIPLPQPDYRSNNSIEAVLHSRRTKRGIKPDQLSLKQLGQMLWAAQGVTTDWGGRTAPSAKSTYPLTLYFVVNNVDKLESGLYKYIPGDRLPAHQVTPLKLADFKDPIFKITNDSSIKEPPVLMIVTGDMARMADAYGGTPHTKEVYLEAGHAAENMYLQAESLKIGMVVISTFDETKIRDLLSIPAKDSLIYLIPIGYPKE